MTGQGVGLGKGPSVVPPKTPHYFSSHCKGFHHVRSVSQSRTWHQPCDPDARLQPQKAPPCLSGRLTSLTFRNLMYKPRDASAFKYTENLVSLTNKFTPSRRRTGELARTQKEANQINRRFNPVRLTPRSASATKVGLSFCASGADQSF